MITIRLITGTLLPPLLGSLPFGVGDAIRHHDLMNIVAAAQFGYVLMGVQSLLYYVAMEWFGMRLKRNGVFTLWRFLGLSTIGGALAGASLGVFTFHGTSGSFITLVFFVVYGASVGTICRFILWNLHG